jgi:hypothetical protein
MVVLHAIEAHKDLFLAQRRSIKSLCTTTRSYAVLILLYISSDARTRFTLL